MKRLGLVGSFTLVALTWLLWTTPAAAAPRINLRPDVGPPTTRITIKGRGFLPNVQVDVYFDTVDQALVTTTAKGTFSLTLAAPSAAQPGKHWLTARERLPRPITRAAQKSFLVRTDWPMGGFGNKRQSWNPYENTLNSSNVAKLSLAWRALSGDWDEISPPVVAHGSVYVGTSDGVYAFKATDGAFQWFAMADHYANFNKSPAVANDTIYLCSLYPASVYAFSATTRSQIWKTFSLVGWDFGFGTSPAVANGLVYAGAWDGILYAFNSQDGAISWDFRVGGEMDSSPSVSGGKVFIGRGKRVYARKADTGARLWIVKDDEESFWYSSPVVAEGIIYLLSGGGKLFAFRAADGKPCWSNRVEIKSGFMWHSSPAVAGGVIYVSSIRGMLHAFKAADGTPLWSVPVSPGHPIDSSPSVANGVVYVASSDDNIYAFDADNGTLLWNAEVGCYLSPVVVADGMVYVSSDNGYLYAFSLHGLKDHQEIPRPELADLSPDWSLTPQPGQ